MKSIITLFVFIYSINLCVSTKQKKHKGLVTFNPAIGGWSTGEGVNFF